MSKNETVNRGRVGWGWAGGRSNARETLDVSSLLKAQCSFEVREREEALNPRDIDQSNMTAHEHLSLWSLCCL